MGATPSKRIVLLGLFGANNLGNDATLEVTLHHLRRRMPDAEVLCVCSNPQVVQDTYAVATSPLDPHPPRGFSRIRNSALRTLLQLASLVVTELPRRRKVRQDLEGARHLIIVGTGILDDFGAAPWRMPLWLWRWCSIAKQRAIRVEFLGVGAGPIVNRFNRLLMIGAVRASTRRSFRDRVSRDYMAGLGLDTSADEIVPDLVFGLPDESLPAPRHGRSPPRTVGVGLMGYYGWTNDRDRGRSTYLAYVEKMTRFVSWLLDHDYDVRLLIGQKGPDDRAVEDLMQALRHMKPDIAQGRLVSGSIHSIADLLAEIARSDILVASRFHNVIGALLLHRPVISIGYAPKFDALMGEMALGKYCQDIEHLDVERLVEQFTSVASHHSAIATSMQQRCRAMKSQVEQLYDSLWS